MREWEREEKAKKRETLVNSRGEEKERGIVSERQRIWNEGGGEKQIKVNWEKGEKVREKEKVTKRDAFKRQ